jgi:hypothetical protein
MRYNISNDLSVDTGNYNESTAQKEGVLETSVVAVDEKKLNVLE